MLRSSAALVAAVTLLVTAGCASPDDAASGEDTEDIVSAFVTCTPVDPAKASFYGGNEIAWTKLWIQKNAKGEPNLTFRIRRGAAPTKKEVWQTYQDSAVNETKKTSHEIHVVLGEAVTYTLNATRSDASAPYIGTLETSEEDTFAVSCH